MLAHSIRNLLYDRSRQLLADRSGNFAIATALTIPVMLVLCAIAIDFGALYTERRHAQGITDIAAIKAAENMGNMRAAISATLEDNGLLNVAIEDDAQTPGTYGPTQSVMSVKKGHYSADPNKAAKLRFMPGHTPYNSVKVFVAKPGTVLFGQSLLKDPTITTEAIAHASSEAAFSVGSRLLRIDGGIVNAILGAMLGTNLSLRAMDYEALAKADVNAFKFMDSLATQLNMTAGTYNDVLNSEARVGQLASAIAAIPGMNDQARVAAQALDLNVDRTVQLKQLFGLGDYGHLGIGENAAGLDASVSALEILTGAAAIANGEHQVDVNFGAAIPGLLNAKLALAIGEPAQQSPWFTIGDKGAVVRTAQTRALITTTIGGPGGLLGTSINLPIYVEVAYAEAKLNNISCNGNKIRTVKVDARPGIVSAQIGALTGTQLTDFDHQPSLAPVPIVSAPLVTVMGQASAQMANPDFTTLEYTQQDIDQRNIHTVSTSNYTQSLTSSLLSSMQISVSVAGLGIGTGNIPSMLAASLNGATPAVDNLLHTVLETLGVKLGEADVRVLGAACSRSVLVQ